VKMEPGGARSHLAYGMTLIDAGQSEEAIPVLQRAIRLNPLAESTYFLHLGHAYLATGRRKEAVSEYKKALQRAPDNFFAHLGLTATYIGMGLEQEARGEAAEVLRINPRFSVDAYAKRLHYRDQAAIDKFSDALRKAGLPDKPPLPLPDKPSIAVLPFVNMSDDSEQEYFSDGLTEEIITALSKTPKLFVIARNSSFVYKGKPVNVQQVSRELGVKYLLEGSVRRSGDQLRITAQLIDATTGNHLWADRYDRKLKEIFALQDEITLKILIAMQVRLTEGEQAYLYGKGTGNLEAYLKLLQGRQYIDSLNRENIALAQQVLGEAIALDPGYAEPYTYLAAAHLLDAVFAFSNSPGISLVTAIKLAEKAIALDDSEANPHSVLGLVLAIKGEYEKGISEAERAVELNPNSADAHARFAMTLNFADSRREEAIASFKQALRLNPVPPVYYLVHMSVAYAREKSYEEALAVCEKAVIRQPDNLMARIFLTAMYGLAGRSEQARIEAREVTRISPKFSLEHASITWPIRDQTTKDRFLESLRKAGLK
jgi:adenylate cyclase